MTDIDAKHNSSASMESVPHVEFVDTPASKINFTSESFDHSRRTDSEARDPPSSPGHTVLRLKSVCVLSVRSQRARGVTHSIEPEHTYNMDEKGFVIGKVRKSKRAFSKPLYKQKHSQQARQDNNRE